jgi:small-conductance mechanosensitive channel
VNRTYSVGDRIELAGSKGDVIDVGLINTTLMEIQDWVDGDQPTGRLIIIPNGKVLTDTTRNYTKDHGFIWDEMHIPLTYASNVEKAKKILLDAAENCTKITQEEAEKGMKHLGKNYYLEKKTIDPQVFMQLTDNWVRLTLRYITGVRDRREIANTISDTILTSIKKHKDITVASQTIELVKNPS